MSIPSLSFLFILERCPSAFSLWLGDRVARLAWLSSRRRRCGRAQISLALPELSQREQDRIIRKSCGQLGRSAVETLVVAQRFRKQGVAERIEFEDGAEELLAGMQGQSPVLVQAHFGGFEVFGVAAGVMGLQPGFPMRMPNNYYVGQKLIKSRAGWGIELFPRHGAVRRMLKHMKAGKSVILATDQDAHHAPIFVPWFGKLAATERAAAAVALRTGSPLLACWCIRMPGLMRFRVGCTLIEAGGKRTSPDDQRVLELSQAVHEALEPVIRAHPEQYLWVHDRYKTRPPEETWNEN